MRTDPPDPADKADELARLIQKNRSGKKWRWIVGGLALLAIAAAVAMSLGSEEEPRSWATEPLERGDLVLTATATGDIKPRRTVTIGAEISGTIVSVEVEANDRVTTGQVLLRFDTEALDNALLQANASLASARANLRGAQATLDAAEIEYERTATLAAKKMASQAALDQKRAEKLRAVANLEASRASVARARAEVAAAETRLSKATITSPIDGVVMTQTVEDGNTVTSALQTPELFVLAEDLSKMELHVAVDEADIGLVAPGQKATFGVDAWPDRTFEAEVSMVSLSPTVVENVVTYTVELTVDNSEGLLRPGMTATATITTGTHEDVLRVPNAALRFKPKPRGGEGSSGFTFGSRRDREPEDKAAKSIWVLRKNEPVKIPVETGPSDGKFTEIAPVEEGALKVGDLVVLREIVGPAKDAAKGSAKDDAAKDDAAKESSESKKSASKKSANSAKTAKSDAPRDPK
jgi:HlyD family secretion protein